jgi:hypothetical protein
MRIPGPFLALACLLSLAVVPSRAAAQTQTINCESENEKRRDCYVGGLDQGSVSLDKQLSSAGCSKGYSWGTSSNNIWVSRGCRARFSYRSRSGQSSSGGGSRNGQITCESRGNDRKECYVANLDPSSVTMDELLSETTCIRGRNWDAQGNNIWVSGGCRARFGYVTRSGGSGGNSGGSGSAGTITCESRNDARKECYVANLDPSSVTMDALLSETLCIKGRTWDAQGNNIWVSGGCRARFGYVTRSGGSGGNNNGGYSASSARQACIERASREWAVTQENLEVTGTNRLDNGQTELLISSKRTKGSCYVNSSGRVQRFSTW